MSENLTRLFLDIYKQIVKNKTKKINKIRLSNDKKYCR